MACPRLLLLDEPALGLAPLMVREVFSSLKAISEQGVTIVLSSRTSRTHSRWPTAPSFWRQVA